MNFMQQVSTTRHEYRLKTWQRVLFLILGLPFIVGGGFAIFITAANSGRAVEVFMPIFFIGIGLYLAAYVLRSRVVIDGTRIEVRDAFRDRAAELSEIEGFRTISSRNGKSHYPNPSTPTTTTAPGSSNSLTWMRATATYCSPKSLRMRSSARLPKNV